MRGLVREITKRKQSTTQNLRQMLKKDRAMRSVSKGSKHLHPLKETSSQGWGISLGKRGIIGSLGTLGEDWVVRGEPVDP